MDMGHKSKQEDGHTGAEEILATAQAELNKPLGQLGVLCQWVLSDDRLEEAISITVLTVHLLMGSR